MVTCGRFLWLLCVFGFACRRASATDRPASPTGSDAGRDAADAGAAARARGDASVPTILASPASTPATGTAATEAPAAPAARAGSAPDAAPYGSPTPVARYTCPAVLSGGPFRSFLSSGDAQVAFIDGDDLLALVNRSPTGALPPSYAPTDLVDLRDGSARRASECESARLCLRREAALGLHRMLDAMRENGLRGLVQSAFRGFGTQCWVFANWARQARGGFCEATAQSALPGHSQHQLGTTVDLFTAEWAERGAKSGQGVFRNGFGCTDGGLWLDENAWRFGFVVPYPIDPDDRQDGSRCQPRRDRVVPIDPKTGYKHEPWHLRFIGVEPAARYHEQWLASSPGSPSEITLEQFLRARRGLSGDAELPICDGCSCGACATLAEDGQRSPCGDGSLRLDPLGRVAAPAEEPQIVQAEVTAGRDDVSIVSVTVRAAPHTPTQTPVTSADGPAYRDGATFGAYVPYPEAQPHRYDDLPGAWRIAAEPVPPGAARWPWRASLAKADLAATWNRANVLLPANAGSGIVRVPVVLPAGAQGVRVTLLRDGEEHGTRSLTRPVNPR